MMKISYRSITLWWHRFWKIVIGVEIICLFSAVIYIAISPKIYEADFTIRLPKIQKLSPKIEWTLPISGLDFMRLVQNPLIFPGELIANCMGEDTNFNRKKFTNSTRISLANNADAIRFTLRIGGKEQALLCANLLQNMVISDLDGILEKAIIALKLNTNPMLVDSIVSERPALLMSIRLSDNYIKPDPLKTIIFAFILGLLFTAFGSILKEKYSA